MKILISAYACNPSGSLQLHPGEDLTGWMLVRQAAQHHRVWAITHSYNRLAIMSAPKRECPKNLKFVFVNLPSVFGMLYRLGFGQRLYYYFWQIAAWQVAARLHRQICFDIFHHLTFGNYWMPSFIGAFVPVPFIWGPIGGGQKTPASLFGLYNLFGQFSEIGRDLAQWLGRNILISRRLCLRRAAAILVCNPETKLLFPRTAWPRLEYFPVNGISAEDLSACRRKSSSSKFRVLTAGRLIRLKGFDLCIDAFARHAEDHGGSMLAIVGDGPEEGRLRRLVRTRRLEDRIQFVPWLDRRTLLQRMRHSDVFLFASLRDGGGAVVVEAMACGIPVVCLDVGGPGFHTSPEWGLKIQPRRRAEVIESLAQALSILSQDPGLRGRLGRAARKRAQAFYLWENLGHRMDDIYRRAIKRASRPAAD